MAIQEFVDEVERSYQETQERLSDPAVYNDHREAAQTGRRLEELEGRTSSRRNGARSKRISPPHRTTAT